MKSTKSSARKYRPLLYRRSLLVMISCERDDAAENIEMPHRTFNMFVCIRFVLGQVIYRVRLKVVRIAVRCCACCDLKLREQLLHAQVEPADRRVLAMSIKRSR
jgi:hypothetical protein